MLVVGQNAHGCIELFGLIDSEGGVQHVVTHAFKKLEKISWALARYKITYKNLEKNGLMMPVDRFNVLHGEAVLLTTVPTGGR